MSLFSSIINFFIENNETSYLLKQTRNEIHQINSEIIEDLESIDNIRSENDIDKKHEEINKKINYCLSKYERSKTLINKYVELKKHNLKVYNEQSRKNIQINTKKTTKPFNPYEKASAPIEKPTRPTEPFKPIQTNQILEIKINRDVMEVVFKEILVTLAFEDLKDYYTVLIGECVNNKNNDYNLIKSLTKLICLIKRDDTYLEKKKLIIVDLPITNERISEIKKKVSSLISDIENTNNVSVKESIAEKIINLIL